jgi:hypothetical protein
MMRQSHGDNPGVMERSTYHVECTCGRALELATTEGQCRHCGRLIELHWGGKCGSEHDARGTEAPTHAGRSGDPSPGVVASQSAPAPRPSAEVAQALRGAAAVAALISTADGQEAW